MADPTIPEALGALPDPPPTSLLEGGPQEGRDEYIGRYHLKLGADDHPVPEGMRSAQYELHDAAHDCLGHFHELERGRLVMLLLNIHDELGLDILGALVTAARTHDRAVVDFSDPEPGVGPTDG